MAYVKVSSEYLTHVHPEAVVEQLSKIIAALGEADKIPTVSRVDLYADFQSPVDMESFSRHSWVTKAGSVNTYSVKSQFSGFTIGQGGPISCRLYNKSLEIVTSKKAYLLALWQRAGMKPERDVWRLEFQANREILYQLGIRSFEGLMREQGGVWGYAAQTWLRLTVPTQGDSNRARWPTHPLWERLSAIRWQLVDVPLTRTFAPNRAPSPEHLCRLYVSLLTSFMATRNIQNAADGERQFLEEAASFMEARCEKLEVEVADWIAMEVAVKKKKFNTGVNVPEPEAEAETPGEVDRDAIDYYKASRGE
jgi:hypothetical protein